MNIQTTQTERATYHILKTAHQGFITGICMVPGGSMHADFELRMLPKILASVLGLGTEDKSEDEINEILESRGVSLHINSSFEYTNVSFTCLTKDIHTVIMLVVEQLLCPRFDNDAFSSLKSRMLAHVESLKDDTTFQASAAFSQLIYPSKHISCMDSPEETLALLEKLTIKELQEYHVNTTSMTHPKWIFVGDINADAVIKACEDAQPTAAKPLPIKREVIEANPLKPETKSIVVKDKQSVDLRIGHAINIDIHHPDYLPLCLAVDALGGSFSARLMRTVRDEDGLTYNVGSQLGGFAPHHHGHWCVFASFSPKLLEKGIASIHKQLKIWMKGLTEAELNERKQGMIGKHTVMLSDAQVLKTAIANNIEKGHDTDYIYTFIDKVEAVTLDQVNAVIKKYIHLDQLISVSAGSTG